MRRPVAPSRVYRGGDQAHRRTMAEAMDDFGSALRLVRIDVDTTGFVRSMWRLNDRFAVVRPMTRRERIGFRITEGWIAFREFTREIDPALPALAAVIALILYYMATQGD